MEIVKWVFYILLGVFCFTIALYCVVSPFALVIGLFSPSTVLDDEKPQTRIRVLRRYGITTAIVGLIGFGTLSSVSSEDGNYTAATHSSPALAEVSTYTPTIQEDASLPKPVEVEKWVNVKNDRAIQVLGIDNIDRIAPDNEFMKPVEAKGGKLVAVGMELKNTGLESGDMMWTKFQLIDSAGRKYNEIDDFEEIVSINTWLKENGVEEASSQLFPGATLKTVKVFRIASDASDFKLAINGKLINIG